MGRGPQALLAGASAEWIAEPGTGGGEVARSFEINRRIASRVRTALNAGHFPLVVAGNCTSAIGVLGGIARDDVGIVWFDAHADFHTPESTTSGFFDGMGLAIATGMCWRELRRSVPGFHEVAPEHVALCGARQLDEGEAERLAAAGVTRVPGVGDLAEALAVLAPLVGAVYLHVDLDVLDPSEGCANEYSAPGGCSCAELVAAVAQVFERLPVAGAAVTAYDPGCDPKEKMRRTGRRVIDAIGVEARRSNTIAAPGSDDDTRA